MKEDFSNADLSRARDETPGCEEVLHFNNAGAALMPEQVLEATVSHLRLEARIGGYEAAARSEEALERVYDAAATLHRLPSGGDRGGRERDQGLGHGLLRDTVSGQGTAS